MIENVGGCRGLWVDHVQPVSDRLVRDCARTGAWIHGAQFTARTLFRGVVKITHTNNHDLKNNAIDNEQAKTCPGL